MGTCCARSYEKFFGERTARRDARRYRRKGLDDTAQRLVDEVAARGVAGASVLEVGGGVGALELELLQRGVSRATIVELSHGYDEEASILAREAGAEERIERRHGDFVEDEAEVDPADIVVMHRVVCCYPDPELLVGAAARHARRLLALSFPRDTWWLRLGFGVANVWFRLTGGFEAFVHSPALVVRAVEGSGLTMVLHERAGRVWRVAVFERA
ncbi:MAG: methyltransferase domain-containing protein [Actinomycetota bacterium]|nr:methyltransferase domain-containing protein [Actinomycetota bacterium]